MTTLIKAVSSFTLIDLSEFDGLKTIALFCGVGLLVSLLVVVGLTLPPLGPETLDVLDWI